MRKAFIAAPLLGSIIFLAAILFTVNLAKIESSGTSKVVNEAYHNRVVSLLEIYRTDLASVFRETVSRNIQTQLLKPGWVSFKIPSTAEDGRILSYSEIRKKRCEYVKAETINPACPFLTPPTTGPGSVIDNYRYGIPEWIFVANKTLNFESISFSPTNPDQSNAFFPTASNLVEYSAKCRALISQNLFDCDSFKNEGVYKCKDGAKEIPGCEEGTFMMKIKVLDPSIYPFLPRVTGEDGFGNVVRSGAISDKDFYLPVNLRLFKYDDYALRFYNKIAYGSTKGGATEGRGEGIIDGLCNGGANCNSNPQFLAGGYGNGFPASDPQAALKSKQDLILSLYQGSYTKAVTALQVPVIRVREKIDFKLSPDTTDCLSGGVISPICKDLFAIAGELSNYLPDPDGVGLAPGSNPRQYSFYRNPSNKLELRLFDSHPVYKVKGSEPNEVKYAFNLKHS